MTQREPSDAEVDAAFGDIVAHLRDPDGERRGTEWAKDHPLFAEPAEPTGPPQPDQAGPGPVETGPVETGPVDTGPVVSGPVETGWRVHRPPDDDELDELDELDEPPPGSVLDPWHPSPIALAALALVASSAVVTILLIAQVRLPWWLGWAALVGFVAGMGLLFSRLPRDRDDDIDNGARV